VEHPKIIAQIPSDEMAERAIRGTVEGMIAEQMPGTEGRTREELIEIVRRVHYETRELVFSRRMRAADATAYEFRRYVEELRKTAPSENDSSAGREG
jgi:hypothetical protein